MLQTQVNYWSYIENKRHNYATEEANLMQAKAALSQAESAARNADTNAYNALINRQNAETNAYNAQINARNAAVNEYNALTNRDVGISNIALNTEKMATEKTQQSKNLADMSNTEQKTKTEVYNTDIQKQEAGVRGRKLSAELDEIRASTFQKSTSGVKNLIESALGLDKVLQVLGL